MILKTEVGEFALHFRHTDDPLMVARKLTHASIHKTPCVSKDRPCLTIALTGIAYCAKSDNFDKQIGRKLALQRALYHFPREIRGHIWKAYFERINHAQ
jgi:hypothetical protein